MSILPRTKKKKKKVSRESENWIASGKMNRFSPVLVGVPWEELRGRQRSEQSQDAGNGEDRGERALRAEVGAQDGERRAGEPAPGCTRQQSTLGWHVIVRKAMPRLLFHCCLETILRGQSRSRLHSAGERASEGLWAGTEPPERERRTERYRETLLRGRFSSMQRHIQEGN